MNTSLSCIPCFFSQALSAARRARADDEAMHRRAVLALAEMLPGLDLDQSPPALARHLYGLIAEITGEADVFAQEKQRANSRALELLPGLRRERDAAPNPLRRALEFAIIGNYIDCGVVREFDWEAELENVKGDMDADACREFDRRAAQGRSVLVLGDNAGEIALDRLLVELLVERGCQVVYAVRGAPVINDATLEDARRVGMTELCEVVSSGVDTPGTVLDRCAPEFLERMDRADLVLSKGQGNFEALCHARPDFFFAFKVKCALVADMTGSPIGHSMLLAGRR